MTVEIARGAHAWNPPMTAPVVLLVPIKPLTMAKTRLRASPGATNRASEAHMALVLAMAMDTVAAASAAAGVAQVVAITSDELVTRAMNEAGVETIQEIGLMGLNPALELGSRTMRTRVPGLQIGAVNADLPALRPSELSSALYLAAGRHAFCRDRSGTGTTLLLAGLGEDLDPHFGPWSAAAHLATGAIDLPGHWPSLRCDVDTESDLVIASHLRLGPQTQGIVAALEETHAHFGS
jgi:2-phospho-L-lactate guanylyltransferase